MLPAMRILIADDHALFRDALARLVRSLRPEARIEEASSLHEVEQLLASDPACDLLLLDLRMPGTLGAHPVEALHPRHPGVPIVVISGSEHPHEAQRATAYGAVGYLRKSLQPEAMHRSLQRLLDGEELDTSEVSTDPTLPKLTPRQLDVLRSLARGASNKLIAQQLGLTEGTVKVHVAAILEALGAGNRTEAAAMAHAMGLD